MPDPGAAGEKPAPVSPAARARGASIPSHAFAKPANLDRQILRAGAQLVHALHGELHALHVVLPPMPVMPAMPDGPLVDIAVGSR